jgi:hypothetical protein
MQNYKYKIKDIIDLKKKLNKYSLNNKHDNNNNNNIDI